MGATYIHHCIDMDANLPDWALANRGVGRGMV
jgi:hypothetical protein